MAHDVFISYSHHDKPTADAICAKFESEGLRCWYAPRDIGPGEDWAAAIMDAIKAAKVFVIVFTKYSNGSQQVLREISAAVNQGIPIIPFRLSNAVPSKGMEYYLSTVHWLDAVDGPLYENISILGNRVRAVLGAEEQPPEKPSSEAGLSSGSGANELKHKNNDGDNNRKWIIAVLAALVLVLAAVVLWQAGVFGGKGPDQTPVPDVIQETEAKQEPEALQETEKPADPTEAPTEAPTETPTETPTEAPTKAPTEAPTEVPTEAPTEALAGTKAEVQTETPVQISAQDDYPELRSLSEVKRKALKRLIIAGDRVIFNFSQDDYSEGIDPQSQKVYLFEKEERTEIQQGTLTDLSLLEGLDLHVLYLVNQPLRSLDGIEKMKNLNDVRICGCENLEDISPLLQLENLMNIDLMGNHLKTVGSFEKLKNMNSIWIIDPAIEDLSGLSGWNNTSYLDGKGASLRLECPLVSDYSFLKKFPSFNMLQIYHADSAAWINELSQSKIYELNVFDCFKTQEDFSKLTEILIRDHPEITRLGIAGNQVITDLSALTKLPNLTYVCITSDMWDAVCSLDGLDYKFELDVIE